MPTGDNIYGDQLLGDAGQLGAEIDIDSLSLVLVADTMWLVKL